MNRKLSVLFLLVLAIALVFTSCSVANKKVDSLQILSGTPTEVEIDQTPDFSAIKVKVTYNDGEVKELGFSDVTISKIDTSKVGKVEYTVTYQGVSATATINVKSNENPGINEVTLDSISYLSGIKTEFYEGADFHLTDLKVTARYSDGATKTIGSDKLTVIQNIDPDTVGEQTLIVSYEGKQLSIAINVLKIEAQRISLVLGNFDNTVLIGESFDTSAITATLIYNNSSTKAIANNEITFAEVDTMTAGQKKLVATYQGMSAECNVEVLGIKSIEFSGFSTSVKVGTELDLSALKATVIATDNEDYEITTGITVDKSKFDATLTNENSKTTTIAFDYCGSKKEYRIEIYAEEADAELLELKLDSVINTSLFVGESFDDSKIKVTAIYSFGYEKSLTKDQLTVTSNLKNEVGTYTVTYAFGGKSFDLTVTVKEPTPTDIVLNLSDLGWVIKGEALDTSKISATLIYDYAEKTTALANSDLTITGVNTDIAGKFELTVSYGDFEKKVSYEVVTATEIKNIVGIDTTVSLGNAAYEAGEVEVEILLSNGVTIERTLESGVTIDTSSYDSTTVETTTLTVKFGDATKSVTVEVVEDLDELVLQKIDIQSSSLKSSIFAGDSYNYSAIKIIATFNYNRTKIYDMNSGVSVTTSGSTDVAGEYIITASYTHEGVTKTASFTVEVKAVEATKLEITADSYEKSILLGDTFDTSKITAILYYNNGTSVPVANADLAFGIDVSEAGQKILTVTHEAASLSATATVTVVGIQEVVFEGIKDSYRISEAFDTEKITVTITGTDGKTYERPFNSNVALPTLHLSLTEASEEDRYDFSYCGVVEEKTILVYALFEDAIFYDVEYTGATRVFKGDILSDKVSIKALYTHGFEKEYRVKDGVVISGNVNTDTTGTYTVTVSYLGKAVEVTINVVFPKVTKIEIQNAPYGIVDEDYDFNSVILNITLENNKFFEEATLENLADYNIKASIDVTAAGTKTLTLTADGVSGTFDVVIYEIKEIVIDAENFNNVIQLGSSFSTNGLGKILVYLKGLQEPAIRYVTEFTHDVNTEIMGTDYTVTTTYLGVTSNPLKITVADQNFVVTGVSNPQSISEWIKGTHKKKFLDAGYKYFVGDDNPFRYVLKFNLFDTINEKLSGIGDLDYEGKSTVTLDGVEVGSEYVTIDEINHTFDFTEAAIGKTFVITTSHSAYPDEAASLEVLIVDGYNIYDAIELNLLTNENSIIGSTGKGQLDVLYPHLYTNNVAGIKDKNMSKDQYIAFVNSIKGIILHNNLTIEQSNFPEEYFFTTNDAKYIWDHQSIYNHVFTEAKLDDPKTTNVTPATFGIYGNYFTIISTNVPIVAGIDPDKGTTIYNKDHVATNDDDGLSSSELFFFDISDAVESAAKAANKFYAENYVTNIYALGLHDNDGSVAIQPELAQKRSKLGIIGIKMRHGIFNLNSVRADRYFITSFPDNDDLVVNYDYCTFYDAWSNHIMTWALNSLDMTSDDKFDGAVHLGYQPITMNITNSFMGRCGGPVIITVNKDPGAEYNTAAGSKNILDVDEKTMMFSYVKGTESWFESYKATSIATAITTFNNYFVPNGASFITNINGNTFFNFIVLNMEAGFSPAGITDVNSLFTPGKVSDIDGYAFIGDKKVLDMDDSNNLKYGHNGSVDYILSQMPEGVLPPIFVTDLNGASFINPLTSQLDILSPDAVNGDYISLYMLGLGALMRLNEGDLAAEPTFEDCTIERITTSHGIE